MDSNIIKKANLNADMQAVREMNEALAQWDAEHGYGKVASVEDAMQILADAGYNADNWVCLTSGYQVYWYETDNRCILYNSATAEVEYPEGYDTKLMLSAGDKLHIYNENHVKAQQFNMSLSSSTATIKENGATISSVTSSKTLDGQGNIVSTGNSTNNLTALASSSSIIATALGGNTSDLKLFATKEVVSGDTNNAYASLQISSMSVTKENDAVVPVLRSDGNYEENVYYLSIVGDESTEGYAAATKAAAQYVYNIFDQITEGKIADDVTIIIAPGTELDCSTCEWAPCKYFTGYFGTTETDDPIIINGATLTSKTGYAQTVYFDGSELSVNGVKTGHSKYFVTGFIGCVYGTATIENITFKNLTIDQPATDAEIGSSQTRNTVGIIGGIANSSDPNSSDGDKNVNVTISNVNVESSTITGAGGVGGLIGYIGTNNHNNGSYLKGEINISNCHVEATLKSMDTKSTDVLGSSYSPVGGIIGLANYSDSKTNCTINITNCSYTGSASGADQVSGCIGDNISGMLKFNVNNCDFENAVLTSGTGTVAGICSTNASDHSKVTVDANTKWNSNYYPLCYAQSNTAIVLDGTNYASNTALVCRFLDTNKTVKTIRIIKDNVATNVDVTVNSGSNYSTK